MTFRAMEIFGAVVNCGSMQAAAEQLYISVPSVSETITSLEHELGQKLFERLNRRLHITPAGKQLYDYSLRITNLKEEMLQQMTHSITALRIGATVSVGSSILQPLLVAAGATSASVMVNNTRQIEKKLLKNELDIALVEGNIHNAYLKTEAVIDDELVLACPPMHPFAQAKRVSWADFCESPLLLREEGSGTREMLLQAVAQKGCAPNIRWESSCFRSLLSATASGFGVTVLSRRLVPDTLCALPIDGFEAKRSFQLVWHKDKYFTQPMHAFVQACRTCAF